MAERLQTIPIREFLETMGLVQYLDMFVIKGFDNESDIATLDENDLDDMLISDEDHRHQILQACECFFTLATDHISIKGHTYMYISLCRFLIPECQFDQP